MKVRAKQIARWCIGSAWIAVLSALAGTAAERTTSVSSTDWPGWRGPRRDGVSTEADWLADWPEVAPLQCYEFETGKLLWSADPFDAGPAADKRPARPKPWASPTFMIADGKMILWGRELVVAKVSVDGYEILSKVNLGHSGRWAAPVLSAGRIYCRTGKGDLICLDVSR